VANRKLRTTILKYEGRIGVLNSFYVKEFRLLVTKNSFKKGLEHLAIPKRKPAPLYNN